ncbi:MAG TPA: hypothetical protein VGW74_17830, partial [Propionibacteriaceae bacterium]|nr:hypothetical protein [Propionibacteriaceae bacterium]
EVRTEPTRVILTELVDAAVARLRHTADTLTADSAEEEWDEAWQEMGRLQWALDVSRQVMPDELLKTQQRLASAARLLAQVHDDRTSEATALLMVAELSPELAFLAGRDFERETDKARRSKREFVREWSKIVKKLDA